MTKRTQNGNRKYLFIDTGAEVYTRNKSHIVEDAIEIKTSDYNEMLEYLKRLEFTEHERIF